MKYALVKNNIVENVAEAKDSKIFKGFDYVINVSDKSVSIGWSYDGRDFFPPPLTPEQAQKKAESEAEEIAMQTKRAECDSIKDELRNDKSRIAGINGKTKGLFAGMKDKEKLIISKNTGVSIGLLLVVVAIVFWTSQTSFTANANAASILKSDGKYENILTELKTINTRLSTIEGKLD